MQVLCSSLCHVGCLEGAMLKKRLQDCSKQKSVKILQDLSLYADRQGSCSVMASQQLQWVCLSHMLECCHTLNHASKGVV